MKYSEGTTFYNEVTKQLEKQEITILIIGTNIPVKL